MDISDGLALDASRLAAASGCGIALHLDAVPIADDAKQLSESTGSTPIDHALGDGEDFELLLTAAPDVAERIVHEQPLSGLLVSRVGECVAEPGLWQVDQAGGRQPLAATGYRH
jgi:thiamine-monophosphate kinase